MSPTPSSYHDLLNRLDAFTRKYYKNQLLRGAIYAASLLVAFYLLVSLLESWAWMSSPLRTGIFYLYIFSTLAILYSMVALPLLRLNRMGSVISHREAAEMIGRHFSPVQDKLLNTLQLQELLEKEPGRAQLILAGIEQKAAELRPIPFTSAIDLSQNKKYLKWLLIPISVLVLISILRPGLLSDATRRLVNHTTTFSKPAPFRFNVDPAALQTLQYNDFELELKMSGDEIPDEVYLVSGGNQYRMEKRSTVAFAHIFRNVQQNTSFYFTAAGFSSDEYELKAVPNPVLLDFSVELNYPAYLGRKPELLRNTGDLLIPAGTRVNWKVATRNTRQLNFRFRDTSYVMLAEGGERNFVLQKKFMLSDRYSVSTANEFLRSADSVQYAITVIPDQFPEIRVEEQKDSTSFQRSFFRGIVADDYGLSKLQFRYRYLKRDGEPVNEEAQSQVLTGVRGTTREEFFHYWDLSESGVGPGDEIEYYFEVWDNDGVSGPKSSRSQAQLYRAPGLEEIAARNEAQNQGLKNKLSEKIRKSQELQKELNQASREMMNKKNPEYQDRQRLESLIREQQKLQSEMDELRKENENLMQQQNEFKEPDPELLQKQQELQKLFDEMMTPEMQKMLEELQKLMEKVDKSKMQEALDQMKMDSRDLEKQLERTLELFKQLELEQKMEETANRLEELSKEQEKLAEEGSKKESNPEELEQKQKELGDAFDQIKKDLKELEKKNQELEFPKEMEEMSEEQQEVGEEMQKSEQELSQGNKQKAGKSQKKAAEGMKKMSDSMKQQSADMKKEQQEEDINSLRALLENLLRFSFEQEALMEELKVMDINNPRYLKLAQDQRKLKDDARIIEDSLLALSKRVIQIQSTVNEKITAVNANTDKAILSLQDRQVPLARANQQYVMTAVNDLALLLSESLDQMQQQMQQQQQQSSASCKKPGQSKPGPTASDVKKMQEKLGEQLKKMKEQMAKGQQGGKGGDKGMNEELARMAAQQEAIRNALNELNQQENKDGKGQLGDLQKIAQQMEENERDIVNKRLSEMTLKRQQDILTRLLESERAEREREQDEQRESTEDKRDFNRAPPGFEEYKKLKMREQELLKTVPPDFTTFYKNLVNSYFQRIGE